MAAITSVSMVSPAALRELFVTPVLRVFEHVLEGQLDQAPVADQASSHAAPATRFSTTSLALLFANASAPLIPLTPAANDAPVDASRNASINAPVTGADRGGTGDPARNVVHAHARDAAVWAQPGTPKMADNTLQAGWSAPAWPGQNARVEVSKQTPVTNDDATAGADGCSWQTRVAMQLPRLGHFEAVITLSRQGIHMALHAGGDSATRELKKNLGALRSGLGDAGLRLCQIEVNAGVHAMKAP